MTIRHHISDDLLLSYAAGSLAEGWSIAVATHLALCPSCRRRLTVAEGIGGDLLETLPDNGSVDDAWASVRSRLRQQPQAASSATRATPVVSHRSGGLPEPLRSYVGGDIEALKWRPLGRGAYQIPIRTGDRETKVRLLRIPAGKPVPEHSHGGRELTLVLSGSFVDGDDVFARGDLEDADASLTHQPVATPDIDCICLAVTDAPLKFRSWIVRAIQPFLGI
ncbi:ChrR family anti-sigma-E factor [Hoeflea sp. 108]|uniref:ChrR family anti-sigma-E factor n=1 Tax=Hoeflea sp. 108 TaxID=1116369 RepID=UPI00037A38FC|nr:ChrR family anti-sigma-E factor [Hoeflea sp. 108]